MNINIRAMTPDDAEAIVTILNPIIATGRYTVLDRPLTVEWEREFLRQFPQRGIFHVAECCETQTVLGFQSLEPFATYTRAFDHVAVIGTYVDLSCRGRGVGKQISTETFALAKKKGYEKIFTYVRADNLQALTFYLALGFRIIGTAQRQAKFGTTYVDEVMIEKFV